MRMRSQLQQLIPLAGWWALVVCWGTFANAQLHLSDRIVAEARLAGVSAAGWSFALPGQPDITQVQVVRYGSWSGLTRQQAVWLSDGSWIAGELQMTETQRVAIEADWLQVPDVPLASVRGLVINPPASLHGWLVLQEQMQAAEGSQDVVWLMNQQRVAGVIRWNPGGDSLDLEGANKQRVAVKWDEIQALVLSPTLLGPLPTKPLPRLGLADGTLLNYSNMDATAAVPRFQLPSGIEVKALAPLADWFASVQYLQEYPASFQFLSDMQPASYRQASDNELTWELGVDRDCGQRSLLTQGGIVAKGIAMHGPAQVAYRCSGEGKFLAQVILADPDPQTTLKLGNVVCRVLLARGGKLEEVSKFGLSRGSEGQTQQLVEVDLTGAQLLVLLVEKGEFGSIGDHVLWLDARIYGGANL